MIKRLFFLLTWLGLALLSGCAGTGQSSTQIAGTVNGLLTGNSVVLSDGTHTITVSNNGGFSFPGEVSAGTNYTVTVQSNPSAQTCTVSNGSGTVGQYSADVSNIVITCTAANGIVYGDVTGLNSGQALTLQLSYSDQFELETENLNVSANGVFAFTNAVNIGFAYTVTVITQPAAQNCRVSNPSGTIPVKGGITEIQVSCQ